MENGTGVKNPKNREKRVSESKNPHFPPPQKGASWVKKSPFLYSAPQGWGGGEMGVFWLRNPLFPILRFLTPVQGGRIRKTKIQPKVFLTEVFGNPLGLWTSAPSGHGCPRQNACCSRILTALTEVWGRDIGANDPRMSAGCPSQKLPLWADFLFLNIRQRHGGVTTWVILCHGSGASLSNQESQSGVDKLTQSSFKALKGVSKRGPFWM